MPKQRITFTRTETITYEFDYKVDPYTRGNVEFWINQGYMGGTPIGKPGTEIPIAILLTEWKLSRSEPPVTSVPNFTESYNLRKKTTKPASKK